MTTVMRRRTNPVADLLSWSDGDVLTTRRERRDEPKERHRYDLHHSSSSRRNRVQRQKA